MAAKRAVFVNLGFDVTLALSQLMAMGLGQKDRVVLVSPVSIDESGKVRGERARNVVKEALNQPRRGGLRIPCEELLLDLSELSSACMKLYEAVMKKSQEGFNIVFELSGGARPITLLMALIAAFRQGLVSEVAYIDEVVGTKVTVPIGGLSKLQGKLTEAAVLKLIAERGMKGISRREIEASLGMPKSTVSRAVTFLKRSGLVSESLRVLSPSQSLKDVLGLVHIFPSKRPRKAILPETRKP